MESSKLAEALSSAQAEFTPVNKSKTAKVKTKAGYEYEYHYADWSDVLRMALPILAKHKLAFSQPLRRADGKLYVTSKILHASGEFEASDGIFIPENVTPQEFGSYLTYWRRYDGCSLLGIQPDEDEDGAIASGKKKASKTEVQKTEAAIENNTVRCEDEKCRRAVLPYTHPTEGAKTLAQVLAEGRRDFGKDLCGGCQIKRGKQPRVAHSDAAAEIVELPEKPGEYEAQGIVTGVYPGDPFAIKCGESLFHVWHKNTLVPYFRESRGKKINVFCRKSNGFYCIERIKSIGKQQFVDNKPVTELEASTAV